MFKTFCAYLTICSLVTSQLAALPPGTGETELTNMPAAAVSSSSTSTSTPQSAAALEEGRQHKDNPNPAESIKPELKELTSAVTAVKSSLNYIHSELQDLRKGQNQDYSSTYLQTISIVVKDMREPLQTLVKEVPVIKEALNTQTLIMNEHTKVHNVSAIALRSISNTQYYAQCATVLIFSVGLIVFCVYASQMAGDMHNIADDIHKLASDSQNGNRIAQNNMVSLQKILESLAKRP